MTGYTPKFCKQYAQVGKAINEALIAYRDDVASHSFPSAAFSPYKINQKEVESFLKQLEGNGLRNATRVACGMVRGNVNEESLHKRMNHLLLNFLLLEANDEINTPCKSSKHASYKVSNLVL